MPLLLLIRHGENDYTKKGKLAGLISGVHLNEKGRQQAEGLAKALAEVPIKAIYSSPLERAMETAEPIAKTHGLNVIPDPGLQEMNVGKWTGRSIRSLRQNKYWRVVQNSPSRAQFPEGESFPQAQTRVAMALNAICNKGKPRDIMVAVLHADMIKLAVAYYIGLSLDHFQRLACDTGSVTVLYIGEMGASLMKLNQRPPFEFLQPQKTKK